MYILGLNLGHNATACLLKDGRIIGCISEERFTRIKNHYGVPHRAINYLLEYAKISLQDVDLAVVDNHYPLSRDPYFVKRFLRSYTEKPLKEDLLSWVGYKFPGVFRSYHRLKESVVNESSLGEKGLAQVLKIPEKKVLLMDHHLAHAFSTCFNISKKEKTLIFTLDGEGSGICATVSIFDGKRLKMLSRSRKNASLGYLYAIATIYLGMKPLEHEFKVMGLAPYAKADKVEEIYKKFEDLIWIDKNLRFQSKFNMPFADHFFRKELRFARFDTIAGAVQKLTEELACKWVAAAIKKTGIRNVGLAGGVFMNVKANQKIMELNDVKSLFIMPSCGDEANAIGACLCGYKEYCRRNRIAFNPQPIEDLYLGPEYDDKYTEELIKRKNLERVYFISKPKDISKEIARLLAKGEIVGRCSGRSEWGARALGNRSILANPANSATIRILNETIKDRDFWMPFTPSILDTFEKKYVRNPKKMFAPYMCITFNSADDARKRLPAALHPYDLTLRPQIVTKKYNPEYYRIIKEFAKLTGTGAILNTSFNLHGEPNVLTPEDALHTLENSDLNYVAIGNYLFRKRENLY